MTGWRSVRLSGLLQEVDDRRHADLEVLSVYRDLGVVPKASRDDNFNKTPEDLTTYKRVRTGDLVVNKMKAWSGSLAISGYDGIVSGDYMVCAVTGPVDRRFLHHLLRSPSVFGLIAARSTGIRPSQWRLYWDDLRDIRVDIPEPEAQRAIADYLDAETARIDAVVDRKRRLAEELSARRRAVAAEAVLPPNLPNEWMLGRLKHIAVLKSGDSISAEEIGEEGEYPVFGGNGIRGYAGRYNYEGTYPLIGRQGALCGNVNYATGRFWASEHAVVVRPIGDIRVHWLGELLRALNLNQYSMAAAQPGLAVDLISDLSVPIPPVAQQESIASLLQRQSGSHEKIARVLQTQGRLIRERRQALITAAVTGQIEIPGVAA
jgi:type I restriction enzyme S subunit